MTTTGLVAALLSWLVLFGTLHAALSVPSEERLSPLAETRRLDYSLGPFALFTRLRDTFVAEILGLAGSTASRVSSSRPAQTSTTAAATVAARPLAPPADTTPTVPGRPPRTVVEHPFDNDDFDDAYPVPAIPFTAKTDPRGSQREAGEPDACEPVGGTVWYRYRPDEDVGLLANSFGSDHVVALAVFRGQDLGELTLIGCEVHPEGNAQVVFPARKGRSYFFQVAAPVTEGKLVFSLDPTGATRLVSVAQSGKKSAGRESGFPSVSDDGRYVSFQSDTENLVRRSEKNTCYWRRLRELHENSGDCYDIYVRDMVTNRTELISKNSKGVASNGASRGSAISGDGRLVVFQSVGTNLVPDDDNDAGDIFVHDRLTKSTERVSVSSEGEEGTTPWTGNRFCKDDVPRTTPVVDQGFRDFCNSVRGNVDPPGIAISSDGRYVVFASELHGLVEPEPPHCTDDAGPMVPLDPGLRSCRQIYVHDRTTNETRLVSLSTDGKPGEGDSAAPFISRNGRWVAFSSTAPNLVDADTNRERDVFVHDLRTGATEIVSVSASGEQGNGDSGGTAERGHNTVSDDGRWVAFSSKADNLAAGDGNKTDDVLLADRTSGQTILVTGHPDSPSSPSDLLSTGHASITNDGRYVAFTGELRDSAREGQDVYVYDRVYATLTRVSVATSGKPCESAGSGLSQEPELSVDGRFVVFESTCHNFDARYQDEADAEGFDIFLHELPWTT